MGVELLQLRQDEIFLRKAFHRSLLPCILSILSGNINILVDGILVGQRIGTDGLSAISLCEPVYLILCVIGSFIVSGTAIQASKSIGRQDDAMGQALYSTSVWLCLIASAVVTLIGLASCRDSSSYIFRLIDDGKMFDPTAAAEPDITLSADDRAIGGLGIHIVRKFMDLMSYEHRDGKNIVTLVKNA